MKIRIKFRKYGVMRFIGHLDMMRYFQKAIRRADIDVAYSEGYSPHQIISFAAPLGVGITSDGEYFDMEVHTSRGSREALSALNEVMVEGVEVTEYKRLPEGTKNAMSSVAAADYTIHFKEREKNPFSFPELSKALTAFLGQEEIRITKQTKKSEKIMDLKPLIYELHAVDEANPGCFLKVSAGSVDNIKPELVLSAFFSYLGRKQEDGDGTSPLRPGLPVPRDVTPVDFQVHRLEVYARDGEGRFLPLGDLGEEL